MEANKKSLAGIFENKIFDIPIYQRGYDWKGVNFEALWQDINYCIDNNKPLFLGTVIFQESKDNNIGTNISYQVVDGQQRITTMTIFLTALRRVFLERLEIEQDSSAKSLLTTQAAIINMRYLNVIDELGKTVRQRLNGTKYKKKKIVDALNYICATDWQGDFPKEAILNGQKKRLALQFSRFKNVYDDFYKKLSAKNSKDEPVISSKKLQEIYSTISSADFVEITVSDESEALYLFEIVNARGKNLEIADLLKNFFFSQVKDWDLVEQQWNNIVENADGAGGISRLLKFFYVSRKGHKGSGSRELYENLKDLVEKNDYKSLLNDIQEFSQFFHEIRNGSVEDLFTQLKLDEYKGKTFEDAINKSDIYTSVELTRDCNVTLSDPLIFSFFFKMHQLIFKDGTFDRKIYDKLKKYPKQFLLALEHLHFMNYGIGDRRANDIEALYADTASEMFNALSLDEFRESLKNLYTKLKELRDPKPTFIANFKKKMFYGRSKTTNSLILYCFDKLERDINTDNYKKIYSPNESKGISLDHWADQNDTYDKNYEIIRDEILQDIDDDGNIKIHSIGNLLPIGIRLNRDMSDKNIVFPKTPSEKHKYLEDHGLPYNIQRNFLRDYKSKFKDWDSKSIDQRADDLANSVFDIIANKHFNI